jgi:hypothetical protein
MYKSKKPSDPNVQYRAYICGIILVPIVCLSSTVLAYLFSPPPPGTRGGASLWSMTVWRPGLLSFLGPFLNPMMNPNEGRGGGGGGFLAGGLE